HALRLEDEVASTKRQLADRRAEYEGLGKVLTLLRDFVERHGSGRLAALERELQAKQRHAAALRTRSADLEQGIENTTTEQQTARNAELASLEALEKRIRPALNALDRFITDFEDKVNSMRTDEQVAQKRLLAIEGEENKFNTERENCERTVATVQQQIFQLQEQVRQLREEVGRIHYRQAPVDTQLVAQSVETLRASYQQQRQLYEGQQDSQVQVEIRTAEEVLQSKQTEFSKQLKDATETEVRAIGEPLDYADAKLREQSDTAVQKLEDAVHNRAAKNAERETAKRQYNDKEHNATEGGKRRFPEGEVRPRTSSEALALLERGRALFEERQARKQQLDEKARLLGDRAKELEKLASDYAGQCNLLDGFKEVEAASVELPGDFAELKTAVAAAREEEK
ncbi:MAG: hypothetical protein L0312_30550, partial [Acidobacteria bacterium]|nr:hypothetical protein [Acidobacteriota bacterium]